MTDPSGNHIRFAAPGQSDTYGWIIATGRHVEVEWKRPGNRPTVHQLRWLKECTRTGAIAFWSDSVAVAEMVMMAVLKGGEIAWFDDGDEFDVEMPS